VGHQPQCFVTPPLVQSALFDADDSATAPHRFRVVTDLSGTPAGAPVTSQVFIKFWIKNLFYLFCVKNHMDLNFFEFI
jgi:hypothetical protein